MLQSCSATNHRCNQSFSSRKLRFQAKISIETQVFLLLISFLAFSCSFGMFLLHFGWFFEYLVFCSSRLCLRLSFPAVCAAEHGRRILGLKNTQRVLPSVVPSSAPSIRRGVVIHPSASSSLGFCREPVDRLDSRTNNAVRGARQGPKLNPCIFLELKPVHIANGCFTRAL